MARLTRLLALALVIALALPAAASAAVVREYQLQFAPAATTGGSLAIVTALVDPQESLPASVTVPVPAGSTLLWAGEILGGDPAADPARTPTMERVGEMDLYTFTLEQSYTAQLEIQLPDPTIDGSRLSATLSWTNPGAEVLVTGAIIVEPGAGNVETTPDVSGEIQTNDVGESLYPLEGVRLAEGGTYAMSVEWDREGEAEGGASNNTLVLLLIALVAALVTLIAVVARERTRTKRAAIREERAASRAGSSEDSGEEPLDADTED